MTIAEDIETVKSVLENHTEADCEAFNRVLRHLAEAGRLLRQDEFGQPLSKNYRAWCDAIDAWIAKNDEGRPSA